MAIRVGLVGEVVAMAYDTVRGNKLRSGLTVLGVVIGITSIVGMTSMIRGFDQSLRDAVRSIGPNLIIIPRFGPVAPDADGPVRGGRTPACGSEGTGRRRRCDSAASTLERSAALPTTTMSQSAGTCSGAKPRATGIPRLDSSVDMGG